MSIAHFASTYVFYFLLGWLPLFLTKSRGLPIREMTFIATLGYAAQAVAALAFGAWSDRWTRRGGSEAAIRRATMLGAQLVAAASVLALAYANTPAKLELILCIAGVATGALSLNTYAIAQMYSGPRAAGTWVGIQNAVGNLSGVVGPILTGIIVEEAGFTAACWVTAAVAAAGALWWVVGIPKIAQVELG
jgi:MFS family permease